MIKIVGSHNTAICYAKELEPGAYAQIKSVCDRFEFAESKIRIMPDVHAGMGCTIGTTMTITDKIVPGMVGVDIGCGMETVRLTQKTVSYSLLDKLIQKEIPSGRDVRRSPHPFSKQITLSKLKCAAKTNLERAECSIGTLGGGNHFIEIASSASGTLYLVVHSGSRHIGTEVASYYQKEASKALRAKAAAFSHSAADYSEIPNDLTYITGELFHSYMHDMNIIQSFASLNRKAMVEVILREMGLTETDRFTTIHNYIDSETMILRKGAVSARKDERLLIPINMRDGSLICVGKGNDDWNQSAPHGAGRIMSRTEAFKKLSISEYREEMVGVFTSSVHAKTLDESPMAYKSIDEITASVIPTVEIVERIRPTYNFKASE